MKREFDVGDELYCIVGCPCKQYWVGKDAYVCELDELDLVFNEKVKRCIKTDRCKEEAK